MSTIIEHPTIDIVATTLHYNKDTTAHLCGDEGNHVNMWAKYKPVRHAKFADINDNDYNTAHWGLDIPFAQNQERVNFTQWSQVLPLVNRRNWQYLRPRGGQFNEIFRLGDFRRYKHDAQQVIRCEYNTTDDSEDWVRLKDTAWMQYFQGQCDTDGDSYTISLRDLKFELGGHDADNSGTMDIDKAHLCVLVIRGKVDPITTPLTAEQLTAQHPILGVFVAENPLAQDELSTIYLPASLFGSTTNEAAEHDLTLFGVLGYGIEMLSSGTYRTVRKVGNSLIPMSPSPAPKFLMPLPWSSTLYPVKHINRLNEQYTPLYFSPANDSLQWAKSNNLGQIQSQWYTQASLGSLFWAETEERINVPLTSSSGSYMFFAFRIYNPNSVAKTITASNLLALTRDKTETGQNINCNIERIVNSNGTQITSQTIPAESNALVYVLISGIYAPRNNTKMNIELKYSDDEGHGIYTVGFFGIQGNNQL